MARLASSPCRTRAEGREDLLRSLRRRCRSRSPLGKRTLRTASRRLAVRRDDIGRAHPACGNSSRPETTSSRRTWASKWIRAYVEHPRRGARNGNGGRQVRPRLTMRSLDADLREDRQRGSRRWPTGSSPRAIPGANRRRPWKRLPSSGRALPRGNGSARRARHGAVHVAGESTPAIAARRGSGPSGGREVSSPPCLLAARGIGRR